MMSDDFVKYCLDGVKHRMGTSYKCVKGRTSALAMMAVAVAGMGGKNVIDVTGPSPLFPSLWS